MSETYIMDYAVLRHPFQINADLSLAGYITRGQGEGEFATFAKYEFSVMINYGEIPEEFSSLANSRIVILPIPYDGTSTWLKGADRGPEALLNASTAMWYYDVETGKEIYREGIYTAPPVLEKSSPEEMSQAVYQAAKKYFEDGKFIVGIGGEHSVSLGLFRLFAEKFKDLTIVQLDAHADLMPEYEESKFNHACVMSRAKELCPVIQIGLRSLDIEETEFLDKDRVFFAHDIHDNDSWMGKVESLLSPHVYLTIDLDVFDPSLLPATGTPEPGGLSWYPVLELIKRVIKKSELVGFDIVELCPRKDDRTSDYIAAKLLYKILNYRFG